IELREQLIDLKGATEAEFHALVRAQMRDLLAIEKNSPPCRLQDASEQIDKRGLAGPIRADQCVPRAFLYAKGNSVCRNDAAEALQEAEGLQGRHHPQGPSLTRGRLRPARQSRRAMSLRKGRVQLLKRSRPTRTITTSTRPIQ